jgi:hypothetical protein
METSKTEGLVGVAMHVLFGFLDSGRPQRWVLVEKVSYVCGIVSSFTGQLLKPWKRVLSKSDYGITLPIEKIRLVRKSLRQVVDAQKLSGKLVSLMGVQLGRRILDGQSLKISQRRIKLVDHISTVP